jgi:hypothetical protein
MRRHLQAAQQEHEAHCDLLSLVHLEFEHVCDGDGENAYVAEEIDDADAKVELV